MSLDKIFDNIVNKPRAQVKRDFNNLFRSSFRFKNLDQGNKDLILDLVDKFIDKKKKNHSINSLIISNEMNNLRRNMIKYNLTNEDLKDIEEIISEFKK